VLSCHQVGLGGSLKELPDGTVSAVGSAVYYTIKLGVLIFLGPLILILVSKAAKIGLARTGHHQSPRPRLPNGRHRPELGPSNLGSRSRRIGGSET
jgi:hypothetical protein